MELIDLTEQQSRMPVLHSLGMGGGFEGLREGLILVRKQCKQSMTL